MQKTSKLSVIRKWFSGDFSSATSADIQVGDQYEEIDGRYPLWEVAQIRSIETSAYPLVSLRNTVAPELERTLSILALGDRATYRRASASFNHYH